MAFPPKKKKPDAALLIEAEPMDDLGDEMPEEEEGDDLMPEEDPLADPLAEDPFAEDTVPSIDPEQAALAETLGFTEPDQQQALIDLIKLVNAAPSDMGSAESALPPLPESTY